MSLAMDKFAFLDGGLAVVIGSTGGIGAAVAGHLREVVGENRVIGLGRSTSPALDLLDEDTIADAARKLSAQNRDIRFIFDATGALTFDDHRPEKSWRALNPDEMVKAFQINAIGPALLMKHFLPLLPRQRKSVFATLSARVGSISDNQLGGWYSYRASKAALNQLVRCSSIELKRSRKEAICVALHPGTVDTGLSGGFVKSGLEVQAPDQSAQRLLDVISSLGREDSGGFFDHMGKPIPW